ncbi:formin-like protein 11 [Humulus lupulus]|uniref:formin-like protein 11 n=1 Tax=Humulus lupulus TaxID=3486 RepID=UPI002B40E307|nr:formin-like protein 11 [Humulus lupulus]
MGSVSQTLLMIFIIIIFMPLSLNSCTTTHNADDDATLSNAYAPENLNVHHHGLQQFEKEDVILNQIEKVSGKDENDEGEPKSSLVEKFRVLLGLRSFHVRRTSNGDHGYLSPAPSPSLFGEAEVPVPAPAPALSPAPVHHIHLIPHAAKHGLNKFPPAHKIKNDDDDDEDDKGRVKRILVAVLVSVGAATLVSIVGLMWAYKKYRTDQNKPKTKMSVYGKKGGRSKCVSFNRSASKVSLNPGLDLFYLDSLGKDLEQQPHEPSSFLKKISETGVTSPNHSIPNDTTLPAREVSVQEPITSEFDNLSSSSTREIKSVHEDAGSINQEHNSLTFPSGVKVVPTECHYSDDDDDDDDESFHSFGDSNSSNAIRLSNASVGSFSDALENFNPNEWNKSSLMSPLVNLAQNSSPFLDLKSPSKDESDKLPTSSSSSINQKSLTPPPPPPPPPLPPPRVSFLSSHFSSCSTRVESKASSSSTLPNQSSSKEPESISGLDKTMQVKELASPPENPSKPSASSPGIPPPPCPPPLFKTNNTFSKAPPPPPSQFDQLSALGKDGTPLPKLKPLHWDKVRAVPDRSMVWDKLRSSSFELDEEMIESLFGYSLQNSIKNDEAKSKTPSPSKHVLEPKRLQNITILSKALNVTGDQVCEAILQGNGLPLQQLEALVKMVPTKDEEAKLSGYEGDITELGSAEKFVKAILTIPCAFQRVEAMLYRETFEDEVVHLKNSFSMLEEACKELRSSRLFLKLLEAVLKTGNRLNVGTIRGGARAFKLDALLKLADVKGTDGKTTLLHFVVQEIIRLEGIRVSDSIMGRINQANKTRTPEEREEDYRRMGLELVSGLSTELYNVKKTAAIDLDVLASSVSNLSDEMSKLRKLITEALSMDEKAGNFINSMNSFLGFAEKRLKELQGDEDRVLSHVKEITEYFHGDVSKEEANPLRIFVIVRDFLGMLDNVCKELRSSNSKAHRSPNPLSPFK